MKKKINFTKDWIMSQYAAIVSIFSEAETCMHDIPNRPLHNVYVMKHARA